MRLPAELLQNLTDARDMAARDTSLHWMRSAAFVLEDIARDILAAAAAEEAREAKEPHTLSQP